jgi:hypothetical protein
VTTLKDTQGQLISTVDGTARFVLFKALTGEIVITKTDIDGITLESSVVTVSIEPTDTELLPAGDYRMQLEVTLVNGIVLLAYDVTVAIKVNHAHVPAA